MKPFKVMCIKECVFDIDKKEFIESPVAVGSEYTVVISQREPEGLYYALEGFGDIGFNARCFATLPEPSAEEMREEVRESIVNIETPV